MSFSTRHLSILSLIISAGALALAIAVFFGAAPAADNPAAIVLPTQTMAKTVNQHGTHDTDAALAYWVQSGPDAYTTYTHPTTGLTFKYLKDFDITVLKERAGEIILGENTEYGMAFQFFIQPYDESGPLTVDRIRRDLPDLVIDEIHYADVMDDGMSIVRFVSVEDTLGRIPEAWIVHNGYLFQLTMYAPGDDPEALLLPWFRGFLQKLTFTS